MFYEHIRNMQDWSYAYFRDRTLLSHDINMDLVCECRFIAGAMFLRPQQILSLRGAADLDRREQVSFQLLCGTCFGLDDILRYNALELHLLKIHVLTNRCVVLQDQGSAAAAEARDSMVESLSSYKAPALQVTSEELQSLLKEAKRVDALISGRPVQPEVQILAILHQQLVCLALDAAACADAIPSDCCSL